MLFYQFTDFEKSLIFIYLLQITFFFSLGKCQCRGHHPVCHEVAGWRPCGSDGSNWLCGENGVCDAEGICRCSPTTTKPPMQCQWGSSCSANEDCGAVGIGVCDTK